MEPRPIIDAGPALNFMSINRERVLTGALGPLSAPETVRDEVFRKSKADPRFEAAASVWAKLGDKYMEILSDDLTPQLAGVVTRISAMPADQRYSMRKDLGELMVVAHAVLLAEAGATVLVVIDDQGGVRLALKEMKRLQRMRAAGEQVGEIVKMGTVDVLRKAAVKRSVQDMHEMRALYARITGCCDGLPRFNDTGLTEHSLWHAPEPEQRGHVERG